MNTQDLPAANRILKREYEQHRAPIVDLVKVQTGEPFKILVATILSSRTKDETTAGAAARLFRQVDTPDDLRQLTRGQIQKLIFPVGFYRTKAANLKKLPDALDETFEGRIPDTVEELCELPGVGRKTANLVVAMAFGKPAVCVDVHVNRISNRFGLVATKTPLETETALREILPRRYWRTWNSYLVSFGQTRCTPRRPQCSDCPLLKLCDRIGVGANHR